jgi:putative transcriptional regulator
MACYFTSCNYTDYFKIVFEQKERRIKKWFIQMKTRIKELRARYNLTQDELAQKVGVVRATILYVEKGEYNPTIKLAHKIAKTLNTTLDELFLFDDDD